MQPAQPTADKPTCEAGAREDTRFDSEGRGQGFWRLYTSLGELYLQNRARNELAATLSCMVSVS